MDFQGSKRGYLVMCVFLLASLLTAFGVRPRDASLPSSLSADKNQITEVRVHESPDQLKASWSTSNPNPGKPWMSPPCIKLLEGVLSSVGGHQAVVLEYGMGGSSIYFSKLVKKYYAVEASPEFYADVNSWSQLPQNAVFVLREQNKLHEKDDQDLLKAHPLFPIMEKTMALKSPEHTSRYNGFESYILQASRFGEERYDFILIDGFARAATAFYVLDYIDERSRVAIHDFFAEKMENWLLCDLLRYYRVEAALNAQSPYVSGGSVIILQKRSIPNKRLWHTTYGDVLDKAVHQLQNCA